MVATHADPAALVDDFILTISDDERETVQDGATVNAAESSRSDAGQIKKRKKGSNLAANGQNKRRKVPSSQVVEAIGSSTDNPELDEGHSDSEVEAIDDGALNPDFEFQPGTLGTVRELDVWEPIGTDTGNRGAVDIDDIIARRRHKQVGDDDRASSKEQDEHSDQSQGASEQLSMLPEEDENDDGMLSEGGFGMGILAAEDDEGDLSGAHSSSDSDSDLQHDNSSDNESMASPVAHPDDIGSEGSSSDEKDTPAEIERRKEFFAPEEHSTAKSLVRDNKVSLSFQSMSISRPVLKGLAAVGFVAPTPIQSKTIPVALLGKDIVGGAVTGSGKTAAFLVPILERLLYRPKKVPTSRVAILMPTRELAVQCYSVAKTLATFTDISFCKLIGGFSLREQEKELRLRPDVIIATPGRFIDHMRNSASFTVDTLEILVLDEADRMLEDGFADELNEILTTIPKSRQTMLFSATMTDSVDKLIRLGMNRPVRLLVDAKKQTVGTLVQEFVRLRPGREGKRLGYLLLLCDGVYTDRVIIFFRQKKEAHRVRILFGLIGLRAAELHGSMTQEQRISSVESFRAGKVSFLLATDLASRGLDIKGVETVINYEAPQSHEIYLHRVGRTARAGRAGRACTIAAEPDRKVVKAAVKSARAQGAKVVSRIIDADAADKWAKKVDDLGEEIEEILKEEKEEKQLAQIEMQVTKGSNLLNHRDEIMARPKRTWFESEREKKLSKIVGNKELNGVTETAKKKGKLSGKEKKAKEDRGERVEGRIWKKGKGDRGSKSGKEKPKAKGEAKRKISRNAGQAKRSGKR